MRLDSFHCLFHIFLDKISQILLVVPCKVFVKDIIGLLVLLLDVALLGLLDPPRPARARLLEVDSGSRGHLPPGDALQTGHAADGSGQDNHLTGKICNAS